MTHTPDKQISRVSEQLAAPSAARLALATVVIAIGLLLSYSPWAVPIEHFFYDSLFRARGAMKPPEQVLIIAIDEKSFQVLQQQWPWPRGLHAKLLDRLYTAGARAVALDIVFSEPSDAEQDKAMSAALRRWPDTVLAAELSKNAGMQFDLTTLLSPATSVAAVGTRIGVTNVPIDSDGFVRTALAPALIPTSLASQAALAFLPTLALPDPAGVEQLGINFFGPVGTIPRLSFYQALDSQTPDRFFKDKLIFVGVASTAEVTAEQGLRDRYPVPYSRVDRRLMPGVEIQATIAANLLDLGTPKRGLISAVPSLAVFWIAASTGLLACLLFLSLRPIAAAGVCAAGCALIGGAAVLLFSQRAVYLPVVPIAGPFCLAFLASPFYQYALARRKRNFIRRAFSMYLSPRVVQQLLDEPERLKLGGELVDATVLFLDIAGFTALSGKLSPAEVVDLVNRCLGRLGEVVFRWDGMIDKYIGDCIMAIWGVPLGQADHAQNAARAALEMREAIAELARHEKQEHGIAFAARIGIASGPMVAGNVGGGTSFNYTVLGDTVNLAARLENANKEYGTQILVSEQTAERLQADFVLREVASTVLRGQTRVQKLFELVSDSNSAPVSSKWSTEQWVSGRN